ncbi:MAG: hypothetical protein VW547_07335 [Alphaproteobacteria bacterium]
MAARGWHRILRVARTIADLDGSDGAPRARRGGAELLPGCAGAVGAPL